MNWIENPVLRGFNPDPSILRVEDEYYIATSSFEWFPGVPIYHSRDLAHWELVSHAVTRVSQIDMRGYPASCGIWAPCLSYSDGKFYLIYTDVRSRGAYKDTFNYLITAEDIAGEWTEPIFLNSTGFDPSLFHDADGKKWLVNMLCDYREGKNPFGGISLQEYSEKERKLVGPVYTIYRGTALGKTEGPHLYRHGGYYYLMVAEGGTGYGHAVTLARAQNLTGPYETAPNNPILTSRDDLLQPLQRAGHGSLVETRNGEWYMAHLCGRPIPQTARAEGLSTQRRCILGRETAIQRMRWTADGWLELADGGHHPQARVPGPGLPACTVPARPVRDDFDTPKLGIVYQSLRIPLDARMMSLTERPGYLRLRGRESMSSLFRQSLVARRQQSICCPASTAVEFEPASIRQMAGLICLYDTENFYYLRVSRDEKLGKCLGIVACDDGRFGYPLKAEISLQGRKRIWLAARIDFDRLQFSYSLDGQQWETVGPELDASILSDEYGTGAGRGSFTGSFIGMCCQDLNAVGAPADFDYFDYSECE